MIHFYSTSCRLHRSSSLWSWVRKVFCLEGRNHRFATIFEVQTLGKKKDSAQRLKSVADETGVSSTRLGFLRGGRVSCVCLHIVF